MWEDVLKNKEFKWSARVSEKGIRLRLLTRRTLASTINYFLVSENEIEYSEGTKLRISAAPHEHDKFFITAFLSLEDLNLLNNS